MNSMPFPFPQPPHQGLQPGWTPCHSPFPNLPIRACNLDELHAIPLPPTSPSGLATWMNSMPFPFPLHPHQGLQPGWTPCHSPFPFLPIRACNLDELHAIPLPPTSPSGLATWMNSMLFPFPQPPHQGLQPGWTPCHSPSPNLPIRACNLDELHAIPLPPTSPSGLATWMNSMLFPFPQPPHQNLDELHAIPLPPTSPSGLATWMNSMPFPFPQPPHQSLQPGWTPCHSPSPNLPIRACNLDELHAIPLLPTSPSGLATWMNSMLFPSPQPPHQNLDELHAIHLPPTSPSGLATWMNSMPFPFPLHPHQGLQPGWIPCYSHSPNLPIRACNLDELHAIPLSPTSPSGLATWMNSMPFPFPQPPHQGLQPGWTPCHSPSPYIPIRACNLDELHAIPLPPTSPSEPGWTPWHSPPPNLPIRAWNLDELHAIPLSPTSPIRACNLDELHAIPLPPTSPSGLTTWMNSMLFPFPQPPHQGLQPGWIPCHSPSPNLPIRACNLDELHAIPLPPTSPSGLVTWMNSMPFPFPQPPHQNLDELHAIPLPPTSPSGLATWMNSMPFPFPQPPHQNLDELHAIPIPPTSPSGLETWMNSMPFPFPQPPHQSLQPGWTPCHSPSPNLPIRACNLDELHVIPLPPTSPSGLATWMNSMPFPFPQPPHQSLQPGWTPCHSPSPNLPIRACNLDELHAIPLPPTSPSGLATWMNSMPFPFPQPPHQACNLDKLHAISLPPTSPSGLATWMNSMPFPFPQPPHQGLQPGWTPCHSPSPYIPIRLATWINSMPFPFPQPPHQGLQPGWTPCHSPSPNLPIRACNLDELSCSDDIN